MRPAYMTASRSQMCVSTERSWVMNNSVRPSSALQLLEQSQHLRLHHQIEGGRGLVGDQKLWIAGQSHGDQDSLPLSAGETVRKLFGHRLGQSDPGEKHRHPPVGLLVRLQRLVDLHRLGDLAADRLDRVEGVQRSLKDDRSRRPASRPQLSRVESEHVETGQLNIAGDLGASREESKDRASARGRLATTGLARQPERTAPLQIEGNPAHGRDQTGTGPVGDEEVAHRKHRFAHRRPLSRGLAISSRVRPTRVKASTTARMPSPAGTKYHQALRMMAPLSNASCRVFPHEAVPGFPRPRKARVVSVRIETGTARVALARIRPGDVGQDVTADDVAVTRPQATGPDRRTAVA